MINDCKLKKGKKSDPYLGVGESSDFIDFRTSLADNLMNMTKQQFRMTRYRRSKEERNNALGPTSSLGIKMLWVWAPGASAVG